MFILLLAIFLSIFICSRTFIISEVKSNSMLPNYKDGDTVLVFRYWPKRWLRNGQVVVLRNNSDLAGATLTASLIKRIQAIHGEIPDIGKEALNELARRGALYPKDSPESIKMQLPVPQGHIFVCGDNIKNSIDSRNLGAFPFRDVIGVAVRKLNA